jgi:hypothetical protein
MARKGAEFNNAAPAVGADAGGRNVVVSLTPSARGYVMSSDNHRFDGIRSSDGMPLLSWSSGDGGAAVLAKLTAWESAGVI